MSTAGVRIASGPSNKGQFKDIRLMQSLVGAGGPLGASGFLTLVNRRDYCPGVVNYQFGSLEDFIGIPESRQKDGAAVGGLSPGAVEEGSALHVSKYIYPLDPVASAASWPAECSRNWGTADVDKGDEFGLREQTPCKK